MIEQAILTVASGSVTTLLIESERQIPGWLYSVPRRVYSADLSVPRVVGLLEDAGELAEKVGGNGRGRPAERIPVRIGTGRLIHALSQQGYRRITCKSR